MKRIFTFVISLVLLFVSSFGFAPKAYALTYGLVAPQGELSTGQDVDFTITIDTEGESVNTVLVGMTYQTQFMQYVRTTNGNTMSQVTAVEQQPGTIIFNGSKTGGFKGTGELAKVTFKIVATSPSSEICALFIPQGTPAPPAPTSPPQPTSASCRVGQTACSCAAGVSTCNTTQCSGGVCDGKVCQSCQPVIPTALPKSGENTNLNQIGLAGMALVLIYGAFNLFFKRG